MIGSYIKLKGSNRKVTIYYEHGKMVEWGLFLIHFNKWDYCGMFMKSQGILVYVVPTVYYKVSVGGKKCTWRSKNSWQGALCMIGFGLLSMTPLHNCILFLSWDWATNGVWTLQNHCHCLCNTIICVGDGGTFFQMDYINTIAKQVQWRTFLFFWIECWINLGHQLKCSQIKVGSF